MLIVSIEEAKKIISDNAVDCYVAGLFKYDTDKPSGTVVLDGEFDRQTLEAILFLLKQEP